MPSQILRLMSSGEMVPEGVAQLTVRAVGWAMVISVPTNRMASESTDKCKAILGVMRKTKARKTSTKCLEEVQNLLAIISFVSTIVRTDSTIGNDRVLSDDFYPAA